MVHSGRQRTACGQKALAGEGCKQQDLMGLVAAVFHSHQLLKSRVQVHNKNVRFEDSYVTGYSKL